MIDTLDKLKCNGCRVCASICMNNAISYQRDELTGFDYPVIDKSKCTMCDMCEKKCPQLNPVRVENRFDPKIYAAWTKNDDIRLLCTSGGIFYELAYNMIQKGGVVVACEYTEDYRGAIHTIAESVEDIIPQCGSKHVQSQTYKIYNQVKSYLSNNRKVLFAGSPCQVAALYSYLSREDENLMTVDFVCNSINAPKAQEKYIDYLEDRYHSKLIYSRVKDKRYGWNNFGSSAKFENGNEYYASRRKDPRVKGYHNGHLFIRDSCLDCKYKILPRNADITLADFWGIDDDKKNPKKEMGTSLVMVNSIKGEKTFIELESRVSSYTESMDHALAGNKSILVSATRSINSKDAFEALKYERFDKVVNKYMTKSSFLQLLYRKICALIKRR